MYIVTAVFINSNVKIISNVPTAKFLSIPNSKIFHDLGLGFNCSIRPGAHVGATGRTGMSYGKRPLYNCPKKIDNEPDGNVFKRNPLDRNGGAEKKISCRARDRKRSK